MEKALFLMLCLGWALPAWADVAIAPSASYLGSLSLIWPLFLAVVFLEMLILWQFWGRKLGYSLMQVLGQTALINLVTTVLGLLALPLLDIFSSEGSSRFLVFWGAQFVLSVLVEAGLLWKAYGPGHPQKQTSPRTPFLISLSLNLPSYLLLALTVMLVSEAQQRQRWADRPPSIKANMHTLQTMIETYGVDWGGEYPPDLKVLQAAAQNNPNPYWKPLLDGKGASVLRLPGEPIRPLCLEYIPIKEPKTGILTRYWIYGYTSEGKRLQYNGQVFALTNS